MFLVKVEGVVNFYDGFLLDYVGLNVLVWVWLNGEVNYGIIWYLIENGVDEGDIFV